MKKAPAFRALPSDSRTGRSTLGLPHELVEAGARRLGYAALIYAGAFLVSHMAGRLSATLSEDPIKERFGLFWIIVTWTGVAMALAVFWISRLKRVDSRFKVDLALVFGVAGSLLVSLAELVPNAHEGFVLQRGISWVCVWIMTFPLLVPNTTGKTLVALLLSYATGPVALGVAAMTGAPLPPLYIRIMLFVPTLICAVISFVVSRILYRMGTAVREAQELGSYRLTEKLGQGGMGEVWKAEHRMLARPAAIKLIRPEVMAVDRRVLEGRFEREAQATALLKSPHTVQLYDYGINEDGTFYYVMELLNGLDLDRMVRRFGPLPAERVLHLLRQVCHSLAEAHLFKCVHRDIKPANLFACRLGLDLDFVKVLDFGLVKHEAGAMLGDVRLTQSQVTSGTPAYLAPEMATGEGTVDGRADLYSLGCVGYWLLTGEMIFQGNTPMQVVLQHVQAEPTPPSQRTELEISEELEQAILSCLEKDPSRRPQSAGELVERLDRCREAGQWTRERAERWWQTNLPDSSRAQALPGSYVSYEQATSP